MKYSTSEAFIVLQSFARKMHILCILLNAIEEGVEIALNPSEISTNILDAIYSVLKEVSLHNSASGTLFKISDTYLFTPG